MRRVGERARGSRAFYGRRLELPRWRIGVGRAAMIAIAALGALYLTWRFGTLAGTGPLGWLFYGVEVVAYLFAVFTAALLWPVRWRSGDVPPPRGTLDVLVPVCGEPVEMVEQTLVAALAIPYPHRTYLLNDGCLAGKPNWRAVEELAKRYDVPCFTRTAGQRGKAGNLNHALARTSGELVAVIDADHVAEPCFADETLGYFEDGDVAFVCTPQRFQTDESDVLNNRELFFYRTVLPAKDAANSAFSCGNASVYRRAALDDVGGFSEWGLVEDLHTSYRLHARGWRSVYHPRPLTTGCAPATAAAFVKQRLLWATDGLRIFFLDNPLGKRGLTWAQRLQYLHTTSFYLAAGVQTVFLLGPPLFLLGGISIVNAPSPSEYVRHAVPYFLAIFVFLLAFGGARGGLRAAQSGLALGPTYLLAALRAIRPRRGGVTEKVRASRLSFVLLPQYVLGALLLASLFAGFGGRGGVWIALAWAAYMLLALAPLLASVARTRRIGRPLRIAAQGAVAVIAVLAVSPPVVPELGVLRVFAAARPALPAPRSPAAEEDVPASTVRRLVPPARGAYLGVFNPDLLRHPQGVARWNRSHGAQARIVHWYQQWWSGERRFRDDWLRMIAAQGAVPMITWEPWRKPKGGVHAANQPRARLALIAAGRYDAYVRSWARGAAGYGAPLLLRPMHEMNGNWYPWSIRTNGNTARDYVRAWRRIHRIFREEGARNVSFVWTVNSFAGMRGDERRLERFFPGARYVDWTSMTGFNWGNSFQWNAWRSVDEVFRETYRALRRLRKPIMISEVATVSVGGDGVAWIRSAFATLRRDYPLVRAVVWFDSPYPGGVDFRLDGREAAAFERATRGAYWRAVPRERAVVVSGQPGA